MKVLAAALLLWCAAAVYGEILPGKFNWRNTKQIAPGIVRAEWKLKKPRKLVIHAVRVDLRTPGLRFHVTGKAAEHGQKMPDAPEFTIRTRRVTTRQFFTQLRKQRINAVIAVNAAPWSPWRPPWNQQFADRMGLLICEGDVVMPPDGKRPSFIVTKEGKYDLAVVPADGDLSHIRTAVSGFSFVLKDGKVSGGNKNTAPRTGYALSADKRYFYIFVADGRQKDYSMGMTHREVGEFLAYLGGHVGVNMDGGGSSTLIVRKGRDSKMLNHQPHNSERTVGASLAISVKR